MTAYSSLRSHAALRALIRNDEALLAHLGQWSGEHLAGDCASSPEVAAIERVLRRLQARRAELVDLSINSEPHAVPQCSAAGVCPLVSTHGK